MSILDELRKLVAEELGVEEGEVNPEASFVEDFGADSLDLVQLMIAIEGRFHLEISDEDAGKLVKVQDAVDYLKGRGILEST